MIKKLLISFALIVTWSCCSFTVFSQSIINGVCDANISIPDNNCIELDIVVSGTPGNQLGQNVFLEEIRLIVSHVWRNDLDIRLISPDGSVEVKLITERGGSGDHLGAPAGLDCSSPLIFSQSVCVADSIRHITSSSNVVGLFFPEDDLSDFYLATPFDPNDTWTLKLCDDKFGDVGALESVELVFTPIGCPAPTELEAFNIRATTIDLDWENNGQCSGNVIIEYGPTGFVPGNGTTAGSAASQVVVLPCFEDFDLMDLEQLTTYDIYVRQTCGTSNYSFNSCKVTAQTDCILPSTTLLENFNAQVDCNADGTCIDCPTIGGVWQNTQNDDIDWIVNSGSTVSSNTGPNNDADPNGQYIYLESSGSCGPNMEAILISDCIEVEASTGICHLSFFYHMFGININTLFLEITTDGINWTTLWSQSGDLGNQWFRQYINLSAYDNQVVQFRFRGISAAINFRGDIALDRIAFYGSQLKASDIFYADLDGDGFGNPNDSIAVCFAAQPANYVANKGDCDDTNPNINPAATELPCNGFDENCSGTSDDAVIFNPTFTATSSICSGSSSSVTVTPSNGGQIFWYSDPSGTNLIDSGATFITPILFTNTTFYFQESQNVLGQTCVSNIVPVNLTVNPIPSITNASGSQNLCENTSFDLSDLVIQDVNNATDTLLFFLNDSYLSVAQLANPVVSILSDTIFYVQAVSSNGCTDELSVNFTKRDAPEVTINVMDTLDLCFQDAPQLITASANNSNNNPIDFNWSTGSQTTETIVFSRAKDFFQTVSLEVTDRVSGCTGIDQIVVHTLPSISTINVVAIQEPDFCQQNGSIVVAPLDGLAPYDYSWSGASSGRQENNISNSFPIPDLEMGAYNITVTDDFGCSKTLPQQFVNGAELGIDRIQDVSCFGENNGAIEIGVGGLINPTYQWSDGTSIISTNQNVAGLRGGIYSVTVNADNVTACPIDSIVVNEPPPLAVLSANALAPSCAGFADGAIDLTITGGTPTASGYFFSWDSGLGDTSTPQNVAPGTYNVTISDALNCSITSSVIVPATPALNISLTTINPACFGQPDGSIISSTTGGTAPYNYQWNDSLNQTTADAYGLSANAYSLTLTDANGCEATASTALTNPTVLSAQVSAIQRPLCNEIEDGSIDIDVAGGTGSYNYLWNNNAITPNLTSIGEGFYSVSISDGNNCQLIIDSIQVTAPELMNIVFTNIDNPLCIGVEDGAISLAINGGTTPYEFNWSDGQTSAEALNLDVGDYTVTVTDANGCTASSDTATLTTTQLLSTEDFLVIDSIQCQGADNGVVFFRTESAAPNANTFSFRWLDSAFITTNSTGFFLSSDFTDLRAGNYSLEIQDNAGCTLEANFELSEPELLRIDTVLVEPPSCFGESDGNVIANIQGGTAPYIFSWTFPNNRIVRTSQSVLQSIDSGPYTLEVIDANNCISPAYTFEVERSTPIEITLAGIKHASCTEPDNGFIDIEASGGRGGISFEWNTGFLTPDLANLDAGIYTLTVTDGADCTIARSFEIEFEEDSLQVSLVSLDNPDCNNSADGAINIQVTGGFGSYQYFWNNGFQDISNDEFSLTNLLPGNYEVSVVDQSDEFLCVGFLDDLRLLPQDNIAISLDGFENELLCFGDTTGAFFITPRGGTMPYQYEWSNGATTQNLVNVPAGNYRLTVTDANNCEWTSGDLLPEILEPSNPFVVNANFATDSLCVGDDSGQIDVTALGGTLPYSFNWSNGATTASIQNLLPGNYTLEATDGNGCITNLDTTIALQIQDLDVRLLTTDLNCFGEESGFIQAKVICGVPPYQYEWSTGDTTENLINLIPGNYGLTVTDAAGGENVQLTEVRSPTLFKVDSVRIALVNCEGIIDVEVSGGVPNSYNYTWRDESGTIISTSRTATSLAAGNYQVTIQDANNCSIELNDIEIDNQLIIDTIFTSSDFNTQSNRGTLRVDSVRGGTSPFSYRWFNEDGEIIGTSATVTGVLVGNYFVLVSDANGCEMQQNQSIDRISSITALDKVTNFNLYPNPTSDLAFLEITFDQKVDISLALLDARGRILENWDILSSRQVSQSIDFSNHPSGLFFIKITINETTSYAEKIIYNKN